MSLRAQSGCCDRTAVTSWQIKKLSKVPDFPSKRLPNWRTRGLEQRRQSLEAYIQVRGHGVRETYILAMF